MTRNGEVQARKSGRKSGEKSKEKEEEDEKTLIEKTTKEKEET